MSSLSFFWKVFGSTVAVILITAFGVYTAAIPSIERSLEQDALQRVEREAFWATRLCEQALSVDSGTFDATLFTALEGTQLGARITLILPDGKVLFDSHRDFEEMDNHASRAEIRGPGTAVTRFSRTLQKEMTYFALPVQVEGALYAYSRVSVPVEDRETKLVGLRAAIRNGALWAALISLLLAAGFARRVTRPLREISELVSEIGAKQTTRRLTFRRDDEVGRLARAVNRMADDLHSQASRIDLDRSTREAIFSALAGGLLAVDHDQRILFINPQARALLGGLEGPLKGTPVWESTRDTPLIAVIKRCLLENDRTSGETHIQGEEGDRVVEITAVPMAGKEGESHGCVLDLRDVSDLRRLEAVRRDFVSNVSHELKTPLTAMKGFTEAMLEDADMPLKTRRSFLEKAHKNTERLAAIVSDLLSLSRLEVDEHELAFEDLNAGDLAQTVLDDLHDLADSRQTRLTLSAAGAVCSVRADAEALGMAITNLVSNAIQYSPEGTEVRVVVERDQRELRIDVIDQGPGIPVHEQERIFERFYRLDKARSRTLGGTGLGLSIVRHVMAAHNGRVELDSQPGQGSRFSLFLPLS